LIVVDTSVWIASFRSAGGDEAQHLDALLDADQVALVAPVRVEILSGASVSNRARLRRTLSALPILFPDESTWELMESWLDSATRAGEHFGVADLLIAALAVEQAFPVWSLDSDFARMARIGFLKAYTIG
jgi:predicted nucleic acid-binding protein